MNPIHFLSARRLLPSVLALCGAAALTVSLVAQEIPSNPGPQPIPADTSKLPHVVIISMGGTIASRGVPRTNITHYGGKGVPPVEPGDWLHDLPELQAIARVTVEDLRPKAGGSAAQTYEDSRKVAKRLNELAKDPTVDGMVVTHGTNTMAETCYYMNLVVDTKKPVVFVGSQRPWSAMSGDGPLNLYNAVRVAATPEAAGRGVLHCMNQYINTARDVTKTSAYRVETFRGIDVGAIGFADPDKVVFYREPTRLHTYKSEFAGLDLPSLPMVECVYSYTEAPGYVIDAMVDHGIKGLVVDGTGAGSPTNYQSAAIKRAQAKGVIIVITTRTRGGRVQEVPQRTEEKIVNGDNLPPEKARLLLQLALTKTSDWKEIKRYFDTY